MLNAIDARERGATIRTRTRVTRVERGEEWKLILNAEGRREEITARALINAAGPWVGIVSETILRMPGPAPIRLVKGSHIVVPKLFDHDRGYIFQNDDNRVVFALPFHDDFTMIGTTDLNFSGDLSSPAPTPEEIGYLRRAAAQYFREEIGETVWAFAGVRSLHDDGEGKPEDITREYHLLLDNKFREAPLLTVYGGKITTYRKLAEAALAKLAPFFRIHGPWTARCAVARRRFSLGWRRGAGDAGAAHLAVPEAGRSAPPRRRLRHAAGSGSRRGADRRGFGAALWSDHRGGGALSREARMGAHRGRCDVAAEQARASYDQGRAAIA